MEQGDNCSPPLGGGTERTISTTVENDVSASLCLVHGGGGEKKVGARLQRLSSLDRWCRVAFRGKIDLFDESRRGEKYRGFGRMKKWRGGREVRFSDR